LIITLCLVGAVAALLYMFTRESPVNIAPDPVAGAVKWNLAGDNSLIYEADTNERAATFGKLTEKAGPALSPGGGYIETVLTVGYGVDGDRVFDVYISPELDSALIREKGEIAWLMIADEDYAAISALADFSRLPYVLSGCSLVMELEGTARALDAAGYSVSLSYPGGSEQYSAPLDGPSAAFVCIQPEISLSPAPGGGSLTIRFGISDQLEFMAEDSETVDYQLESGVYDVLITHGLPSGHLSGKVYYRFALEVKRPVELKLSEAEIAQGQATAVRLTGAPEGQYYLLSLMSEYDPIPMARQPSGAYAAILSVPVLAAPGDYDVTVISAGGAAVAQVPLRATKYEFERQDLTVTEDLNSVLSDDNQKKDDAKLAGIYDHPLALPQWEGRFIAPCEGGITTKFAQQRYINGVFSSTHSGVDIAAAQGTEVRAAAGGRVIFADELIVSGNTVIIDHGMGVYSSYLHLSRIDIEVGDMAAQGQVIGLVGSTGFSTGPHLHWTVRINGRIVDPFWLTRNDLTGLLY